MRELLRLSNLTTKSFFLLIGVGSLILVILQYSCFLITMTAEASMVEEKFLQALLLNEERLEMNVTNGSFSSSNRPQLHDTIRVRDVGE